MVVLLDYCVSIKFCTQFSLSTLKLHLDSDTVCAVQHPMREQIESDDEDTYDYHELFSNNYFIAPWVF